MTGTIESTARARMARLQKPDLYEIYTAPHVCCDQADHESKLLTATTRNDFARELREELSVYPFIVNMPKNPSQKEVDLVRELDARGVAALMYVKDWLVESALPLPPPTEQQQALWLRWIEQQGFEMPEPGKVLARATNVTRSRIVEHNELAIAFTNSTDAMLYKLAQGD